MCCGCSAEVESWISVPHPHYSRRGSELLVCVSDRRRPGCQNKSSFGGTVSSLCLVIGGQRVQESLVYTLVMYANARRLISFCFVEELSADVSLQIESLMRNELTSHSQLCTFILSQEASLDSPCIINPEPHPCGYGFCFLMSNLAPYYIIHWYVNEGFFGVRLCLCGDDTESACRVKKVSLVL